MEKQKKKVYTYIFGYFSNSMGEKKNVYMYFFLVIFQQLKRKKNYAQKVQQKRIWATAQLYCEKIIFFLYFNLGFCIAREGFEW